MGAKVGVLGEQERNSLKPDGEIRKADHSNPMVLWMSKSISRRKVNNPKNSSELVERVGNFGMLSPFLRSTDDGKLALLVYKCIRYDCDYISPKDGYCKTHQTELVGFVFVMS